VDTAGVSVSVAGNFDKGDGSMTESGSLDAAGQAGTARYDVLVVGAGIVGLGVAYAAHRRGLRVLVCERASEVVGASVRNFGHLCFTPQSGRAYEFAQRSRELWRELAREADFWLQETGTWVVARTDEEFAVLREFARVRGPREVHTHTVASIESKVPVAEAVGGVLLPLDCQVNPREAASAVRAYLQRCGVEFRFRTAVGAVASGVAHTSRGDIRADQIVLATNHDIDLLMPDLAQQHGVLRCGLDMMRVTMGLRAPLTAPLLTGWSLLRYSGFADMAATVDLRARLHSEFPELAQLDLNEMYTQLPDGSVIVGDTHYRGESVASFQREIAFDSLLSLARERFDVTDVRVLERWQGMYASAANEFLQDIRPDTGIHVAVVTTGIGMSCGLGFAEHTVARIFADSTWAGASPVLREAAAVTTSRHPDHELTGSVQ